MKKNIIDLYMEWAKDQTDAPVIYHRLMAYTILSSILRKQVYLEFGYKKLYPNLYGLIIGNSSLHRKSWSMGMGMHLLDRIKPDLEIQETSSRESFISEFAMPERDGCGIICIDELKGFMTRVTKGHHFNGFIQDLSSIYDNRTIRRRKGVNEKEKEEFRIIDPFLNFVGCCSMEWLEQSIQESDILGGFFTRFLWAIHTKSNKNPQTDPLPPDPIKTTELLSRLDEIRNIIGMISWDKSVSYQWESWYKYFRMGNQTSQWDATAERSTVIVKKLAMLNCVARNEMEETTTYIINENDLKKAIAFVEDSFKGLSSLVLGSSKVVNMSKKIINYMKEHDFAEITQTGIFNIFHNNVTAKEVTEVITTMINSGSFDASQIDSIGTSKKTTVYRLTN